MNQRYLEQWSEIARHIQKPLQEMLELNIKTLKNFKFLKAEDLTTIKNPEELVEKQVNLAIENGHNALDYLKQSFAIFEQTLQPITETVKHSSRSTRDTAMSLKALLDPTKLTRVPTKAAIDITKPLLDPTSSSPSFDPRRAMMEIAGFSFASDKSPSEKSVSHSGSLKTNKQKKN